MFNSSAMGEIGMPVGQQNAALSDELVMRVGPRRPPKLPHLWPLKLLHLARVN